MLFARSHYVISRRKGYIKVHNLREKEILERYYLGISSSSFILMRPLIVCTVLAVI